MKAIGIILAGGNNKLMKFIKKEGNRGNAGCGKLQGN